MQHACAQAGLFAAIADQLKDGIFEDENGKPVPAANVERCGVIAYRGPAEAPTAFAYSEIYKGRVPTGEEAKKYGGKCPGSDFTKFECVEFGRRTARFHTHLLALKPDERLGPIVVTLDDQERTPRRAFVIIERDFFGALAKVA